MKRSVFLISLGLALAASSRADTRTFFTPIPLEPSSEAVVAVFNPDAVSAEYNIRAIDALSGQDLFQQNGTLQPFRGATGIFYSQAPRDAVVVIVTVNYAKTTKRLNVTSVTVRDWITKAPQFTGEALDGGDI